MLWTGVARCKLKRHINPAGYLSQAQPISLAVHPSPAQPISLASAGHISLAVHLSPAQAIRLASAGHISPGVVNRETLVLRANRQSV